MGLHGLPGRRRLRLLLLLAATCALAAARALPGSSWLGGHDVVSLRYEVRVADAARGLLDVTLWVDGLGSSQMRLGYAPNAVATTAPASKFRVREALGASQRPLPIQRESNDWRMETDGSRLQIRYEVHLEGARGRGAFTEEVLSRCDAEGARLLGSDVFLFPLTRRVDGVWVSYTLPPGWQLIHPFQVGERTAVYPDLKALYNSAVALGPYRTLSRSVEGCRLILAVQGNFLFGDVDLMNTIADIARYQIGFFGGPVRQRYLFIVNPHPHSGDPGMLHYFGLHFDGSMIVLLDRRTDRKRLQIEPAQICAHEFFHNWNGELLAQSGYDMNWFVEGVTTWYAYRTRLGTRMLDSGRYAQELRERFANDYVDQPLRSRVSVAAAGRHVLQDPEITRLLYSGGLFVALALDDAIDTATNHHRDLDDLMRRLVDRARAEPNYRLTRGGLELELQMLTGQDFRPWLQRHVYGTEMPPLPGYVTES